MCSTVLYCIGVGIGILFYVVLHMCVCVCGSVMSMHAYGCVWMCVDVCVDGCVDVLGMCIMCLYVFNVGL